MWKAGWANNCCWKTHWGHLTRWISWSGAPLTLFVCSLSVKCIHTHTQTHTNKSTTRARTHISHIDRNNHRHTLPEDDKHHFVGRQETCCFADECAWPVTAMFAVNILSPSIITSLWPSLYKPAAGALTEALCRQRFKLIWIWHIFRTVALITVYKNVRKRYTHR